MAKLADMLAQKAALEKEIERIRNVDKAEALAKARSLMSEYGLTTADISGLGKIVPVGGKVDSARKVEPKYRDPNTAQTWSGRGLKPKWLTAAIEGGKSLEDFAINRDKPMTSADLDTF